MSAEMRCSGYTISDSQGNYPRRVIETDRQAADTRCKEDQEVGFVWEDAGGDLHFTFDGLPPG